MKIRHLALTACSLLIFSSPLARAQVLLTENFNFTGALTNNGWTAVSGGGSNAITAATPSLVYPSLPSSGSGNAASLATSGEDDRKTFTSTTADVYTSFLVNLSAAQATGDYFYTLSSGTSGFVGRFFAKSSGTGFQFGIQKGSTAPPTYYATDLAFGTTYLVVIKITKNSGTTSDDVASFWVNPALGGSETTPSASATTGSDQTSIDSVILRQGGATTSPTARVGNILVGTTWASVTPTSASNVPVVTGFSPTSGLAGTSVTIGGSNFTGATNVAFNGVSASFTVNSSTNISTTVPVGAFTGPISVFTAAGTGASSNNFVVPTVSVVASSIIEGTSGYGEVRINATQLDDLEIALSSSSTNDLAVDSSVIVYGGTTNAFFGMSAPSDGIIDANTNVTVTPTATGYASSPGTITVVNGDALKIPLSTFDINSYTQDFNSLGVSAISNAISLTSGVQSSLGSIVATNLNGWFAAKIAGSGGIANILADNGSGNSAAIYNYGSTNSPADADRSLGTLATGSLTGAFGGLVVNNTGATINSIIINLTGKFWRSSTSAQNYLTFGYGKIDNTTFNNNNFLSATGAGALPSANVVGPLPVSSNGALDGNNPTNQVAISNVSIPVILAPGETMFFRWQDFDNSGSDAGLAIDNLSLTASTNAPLPVAGSVFVDQFSLGQTNATASSSVITDSGASLTARGFVYALSSVSSNPVIGGSNVVVLTNNPPDVGYFTNTLTGLTANTAYSIRSFAANGAGTNYSSAVAFSTLAVPPSFTIAYTQNFNGFTNMAALPVGWRALSTSNINTYAGNWNSPGSGAAGFYGRTNIPGVLGYQHTSATGILSNTLTLVNSSGGTLTNLFVSYLGEVNLTTNGRSPAWTVVVDGQTNASLAYSTSSGSNEFKSAEITGLAITNGGNIVISWSSDRGAGSGSSRMIGMTGVRVATTAPTAPSLSVSGTLTNFATTTGTASASQSFSASGIGLLGNITVTAPTNYQVSIDNAAFSPSVSIASLDGTVASTPVYVRIAATAPVGSPSGNVSVASAGTTAQTVSVSGTVSQAGQTFTAWAGGAPLNSTNLLIYAIGGATNPTATNGLATTSALTSSNLSITAAVRTNDPSLSTFGYAVTNLVTGPWSSNGVSMTPASSQTGAPLGCQIQIFSTPRNSAEAKFLRLQSTLTNQ